MKLIRSLALTSIYWVIGTSSAWAADCVSGVYTASTTCTVPAGVTSMTIEAWGGGGGGGGGAFGPSGGGGGGGSYCQGTYTVAAGNALQIRVGAAGAAGPQSSIYGTALGGGGGGWGWHFYSHDQQCSDWYHGQRRRRRQWF